MRSLRVGHSFVLLTVLGGLSVPPAGRAAELPLRQRIDTALQAASKAHKVTPAGLADDATFLRRVHLDLIGVIPTHDEAKAFLADRTPDRRARLIERLLADPRFATNQANVWDLALFGRNPGNGDATRKRDDFRAWLAGRFSRNDPYNRWVRDLLLAEQPGSELFHVQFRNRPEDETEAVTRIFLGTQLQCARCHDHPYESWTQRDFYGMAGFLVRLVVLDQGAKATPRFRIGEKRTGEVLFSGAAKDQRPGRRGEPVRPKFLGGKELDEPAPPKGLKEDTRAVKSMPRPDFSRKEKLADWLTSKDNPYFARAVVNRVWAQFLGRGLVHPVDDLGGKNEADHPELFKAVTAEFLAHDFDLKWLIREIVSTQSYQLSGQGKQSDAAPRSYDRARVRPLSAEELLASLRTATGFDVAGGKLQGGTVDYFVRYFGTPTNGQGEFQGGLSEHLFLNNSPQVRGFLRRMKGNLADTLLTSSEPWEQRVDRLFLSVLSRMPTPAERRRFVEHLTSEPKADPLVEEAIWALVNSAAFRFNH